MVTLTTAITFSTLCNYEHMIADDYNSEETVLWIKETAGGRRFLTADRITGLWHKIFTIGILNTILSWFNCGNASIGAVMQFLSQTELKKELTVRYLNPDSLQETEQFDKSVARINILAAQHGIAAFSLPLTQDEKSQLKQTIGKMAEAKAEQDKAAAIAMQKWKAQYEAEEQKKRYETARQRQLERQILPQQPYHSSQPLFGQHLTERTSISQSNQGSYSSSISTRVTQTGSSGHIEVTKTINGVTEHYSKDF